MKMLGFLVVGMLMTGCAGMTYSDVKTGYMAARIVYKDAKYVLHELKHDKEKGEVNDNNSTNN